MALRKFDITVFKMLQAFELKTHVPHMVVTYRGNKDLYLQTIKQQCLPVEGVAIFEFDIFSF